jgi:hypothetical protein
MLTDVVTTLRIIVEIALFSLMGQGVLAVLPGVDRDRNLFYQVLKTLASPAMRVARWVSPRFVDDRHVGWVALFILLVLWFGLQILKQITFAVENQ